MTVNIKTYLEQLKAARFELRQPWVEFANAWRRECSFLWDMNPHHRASLSDLIPASDMVAVFDALAHMFSAEIGACESEPAVLHAVERWHDEKLLGLLRCFCHRKPRSALVAPPELLAFDNNIDNLICSTGLLDAFSQVYAVLCNSAYSLAATPAERAQSGNPSFAVVAGSLASSVTSKNSDELPAGAGGVAGGETPLPLASSARPVPEFTQSQRDAATILSGGNAAVLQERERSAQTLGGSSPESILSIPVPVPAQPPPPTAPAFSSSLIAAIRTILSCVEEIIGSLPSATNILSLKDYWKRLLAHIKLLINGPPTADRDVDVNVVGLTANALAAVRSLAQCNAQFAVAVMQQLCQMLKDALERARAIASQRSAAVAASGQSPALGSTMPPNVPSISASPDCPLLPSASNGSSSAPTSRQPSVAPAAALPSLRNVTSAFVQIVACASRIYRELATDAKQEAHVTLAQSAFFNNAARMATLVAEELMNQHFHSELLNDVERLGRVPQDSLLGDDDVASVQSASDGRTADEPGSPLARTFSNLGPSGSADLRDRTRKVLGSFVKSSGFFKKLADAVAPSPTNPPPVGASGAGSASSTLTAPVLLQHTQQQGSGMTPSHSLDEVGHDIVTITSPEAVHFFADVAIDNKCPFALRHMALVHLRTQMLGNRDYCTHESINEILLQLSPLFKQQGNASSSSTEELAIAVLKIYETAYVECGLTPLNDEIMPLATLILSTRSPSILCKSLAAWRGVVSAHVSDDGVLRSILNATAALLELSFDNGCARLDELFMTNQAKAAAAVANNNSVATATGAMPPTPSNSQQMASQQQQQASLLSNASIPPATSASLTTSFLQPPQQQALQLTPGSSLSDAQAIFGASPHVPPMQSGLAFGSTPLTSSIPSILASTAAATPSASLQQQQQQQQQPAAPTPTPAPVGPSASALAAMRKDVHGLLSAIFSAHLSMIVHAVDENATGPQPDHKSHVVSALVANLSAASKDAQALTTQCFSDAIGHGFHAHILPPLISVITSAAQQQATQPQLAPLTMIASSVDDASFPSASSVVGIARPAFSMQQATAVLRIARKHMHDVRKYFDCDDFAGLKNIKTIALHALGAACGVEGASAFVREALIFLSAISETATPDGFEEFLDGTIAELGALIVCCDLCDGAMRTAIAQAAFDAAITSFARGGVETDSRQRFGALTLASAHFSAVKPVFLSLVPPLVSATKAAAAAAADATNVCLELSSSTTSTVASVPPASMNVSVADILDALSAVAKRTGTIRSSVLLDWVIGGGGRSELLLHLAVPPDRIHLLSVDEGHPEATAQLWAPLLLHAETRSSILVESQGGVTVLIPAWPAAGLTCAGWVRYDSDTSGAGVAVPLLEFHGHFDLSLDEDAVVFHQHSSATQRVINDVSLQQVGQGHWMHVGVTAQSNGAIQIFVNGSLISSFATEQRADVGVQSKITIGLHRKSEGCRVRVGSIDVWGSVLKDADMAALFAVAMQPSPQLMSQDIPVAAFETLIGAFAPHRHDGVELKNCAPGGSVAAIMWGDFAPPPSSMPNYKLLFASRGGCDALLALLARASTSEEVTFAVTLIRAVAAHVDTTEATRPKLFGQIALYLKQVAPLITIEAATQLVGLAATNGGSDGPLAYQMHTGLMTEFILADVELWVLAREEVQLFVMSRLAEFFDISTNKQFARANVDRLGILKPMDRLLHSLVRCAFALSVNVIRAVVQVATNILIASDFSLVALQSMMSLIAMLTPKPKAKVTRRWGNTVNVLEFPLISIDIPLHTANIVSVLLLRDLLRNSRRPGFHAAFASIATVEWFIVIMDRYSHPEAVTLASKLLVDLMYHCRTTAGASSKFPAAVKAAIPAFVRGLEHHDDLDELLMVLLAGSLGKSSQLTIYITNTSAKPVLQQMDELLGSTANAQVDPCRATSPIFFALLMKHLVKATGSSYRLTARDYGNLLLKPWLSRRWKRVVGAIKCVVLLAAPHRLGETSTLTKSKAKAEVQQSSEFVLRMLKRTSSDPAAYSAFTADAMQLLCLSAFSLFVDGETLKIVPPTELPEPAAGSAAPTGSAGTLTSPPPLGMARRSSFVLPGTLSSVREAAAKEAASASAPSATAAAPPAAPPSTASTSSLAGAVDIPSANTSDQDDSESGSDLEEGDDTLHSDMSVSGFFLHTIFTLNDGATTEAPADDGIGNAVAQILENDMCGLLKELAGSFLQNVIASSLFVPSTHRYGSCGELFFRVLFAAQKPTPLQPRITEIFLHQVATTITADFLESPRFDATVSRNIVGFMNHVADRCVFQVLPFTVAEPFAATLLAVCAEAARDVGKAYHALAQSTLEGVCGQTCRMLIAQYGRFGAPLGTMRDALQLMKLLFAPEWDSSKFVAPLVYVSFQMLTFQHPTSVPESDVREWRQIALDSLRLLARLYGQRTALKAALSYRAISGKVDMFPDFQRLCGDTTVEFEVWLAQHERIVKDVVNHSPRRALEKLKRADKHTTDLLNSEISEFRQLVREDDGADLHDEAIRAFVGRYTSQIVELSPISHQTLLWLRGREIVREVPTASARHYIDIYGNVVPFFWRDQPAAVPPTIELPEPSLCRRDSFVVAREPSVPMLSQQSLAQVSTSQRDNQTSSMVSDADGGPAPSGNSSPLASTGVVGGTSPPPGPIQSFDGSGGDTPAVELFANNSQTRAGGSASVPASTAQASPSRSTKSFDIAALEAATTEEFVTHIALYVPSTIGPSPPFSGDTSFAAPEVVKSLTPSGLTVLRYMIGRSERALYLTNAFKIWGFDCTPVLLVLTDKMIKLFAFAQVLESGDIVMLDGDATDRELRDGSVGGGTGGGAGGAGMGRTMTSDGSVSLDPEERGGSVSRFADPLAALPAASVSKLLRFGNNFINKAIYRSANRAKALGAKFSRSIRRLSDNSPHKSLCWMYGLYSVKELRTRFFYHQDVALELVMDMDKGPFLAILDRGFSMNTSARDALLGELRKCETLKGRVSVVDDAARAKYREAATTLWSTGQLSNYDYLMMLNQYAGRTVKDWNQYPVMPWVAADFVSASVELTPPVPEGTIRDLMYPIGAQYADRRAELQERFAMLQEMADDPDAPSDATDPPCHFSTHYSGCSTPLYFLIRLEPFTTMAAAFQGGRLDHADRLFRSIFETFRSVTTSGSDCKELIPEFYSNSLFVQNLDNMDLGILQDGTPLDNVALPPWAPTPQLFVHTMRAALESEVCTEALHHWIDLIFGVKQRGEAARAMCNTYHALTYGEEVAKALKAATTAEKRDAIVQRVTYFGQTPRVIFKDAHPRFQRTTATFTRLVIEKASEFVTTEKVVHQPHPLFFAPNSAVTAIAVAETGIFVTNGRCALTGVNCERCVWVNPATNVMTRHALREGTYLGTIPFVPPCGCNVTCIAFGIRETLGFVCVDNGVVYVLNVDQIHNHLQLRTTMLAHHSPVTAVVRCPKLGRVMTVAESAHDAPVVWRFMRRRALFLFRVDMTPFFKKKEPSKVTAACFDDSDGSIIATTKHHVAVFDACGLPCVAGTLPSGFGNITAVAALPQGEWGLRCVLTGHADGVVCAWNITAKAPSQAKANSLYTIACVGPITTKGAAVTALHVDPDRRHIYAGHANGTVRQLSLRTPVEESSKDRAPSTGATSM